MKGELLAPIRARLAASAVLQAIGAAAGIVPFIAVADLARELVAPDGYDTDALWRNGAVAVVAFLVAAAAKMSAGTITHLADAELQDHLRHRIVDRLGRVPLGWFTDHRSSTVKRAVTDDLEAMHHLVAHAILDLVSAVVAPMVALGYLISVDWKLALVACVPLAVGLALYGSMMSLSIEMMQDYHGAMAQVDAAAVEFVQGIAVVKTFGETGRAHDRFLDQAAAFRETFWNMMRGLLRRSAVTEVVLSPVGLLASMLVVGFVFVDQGWAPAVDVVPFLLLGLGLTAPLLTLSMSSETLKLAAEASVRIEAIIEADLLPQTASPDLPDGHRIELEGVALSYDGEVDAVSAIDLTIEPGTVTAFVGSSGAGKTTLARLLLRFWDPTAGSVRLGGVDLRELAPEVLMARVSCVFQDVQLLQTTVADNLSLARPDASRDEIESAARAAQVHDVIAALPRGYESVVGEDASFSGGEAQRISIARAIVADAPILVLDEATSFTDPENEDRIQGAIATAAAGRTLVVVAHRLSTVVDADQIVVLDGGRIVERGTHRDLLAAGGRYRTLWDLHERGRTWTARPEVEAR